MTTKTGAVISKQSYDSQVQISKNSQGNINSITSSRDGMLSFSRSSNNLIISQYEVSQVSRNVRGEAVPQGAPVKVYSYEWNPVKGAMILTSRSPLRNSARREKLDHTHPFSVLTRLSTRSRSPGNRKLG
ncbi:hypothetical protein [Akkermansia sp.]|uniref:hypothetical protein n=1 Tax=Akkermansia sp. TaxID=1872421 RepID=UPI003A9586F6